jgi:2,3-dihydroxybiphenyl 1,2-dioxygenase
MMASVTQLGYLGLGVSDTSAWRKHATDVLGFEIADDSERNTLYLRMDQHHHRVTVHGDGNDDLDYIGWEVKDAQALQALASRLEESGFKVTAGTKEDSDERRVLDLVRLEDPSGIPTEIYYGPLIEQRNFLPTRPVSGFRTGDLGMGHLVIFEHEVQQAVHFYRDLLGMRISDFVHLKTPGGVMEVAFLHCNPRHHSIAFVGVPTPRRMHHFMVECNSLDDVGTGLDQCAKAGVPATSIGKHTNDLMTSFYMRAPSGFQIEYGWGGRDIDDTVWQDGLRFSKHLGT